MRKILLSLTPIILAIASFYLVYSGIKGWGWFLLATLIAQEAISSDCDDD